MTEAGPDRTATKPADSVDLLERLPVVLREGVRTRPAEHGTGSEVLCPREKLRELCRWLTRELGFVFATLVVEETAAPAWQLAYHFYAPERREWVEVRIEQGIDDRTAPSVSDIVHAADWHERGRPRGRSRAGR